MGWLWCYGFFLLFLNSSICNDCAEDDLDTNDNDDENNDDTDLDHSKNIEEVEYSPISGDGHAPPNQTRETPKGWMASRPVTENEEKEKQRQDGTSLTMMCWGWMVRCCGGTPPGTSLLSSVLFLLFD